MADRRVETIAGSCLCGGVRFEIAKALGPFELCHCSRCRKASGSAFAAMLGVRSSDFHFVGEAKVSVIQNGVETLCASGMATLRNFRAATE